MRRGWIAFGALLASMLAQPGAARAEDDLIIRNARIVDARGDRSAQLATITIRDGVVARIERATAKVAAPAGIRVIDAGGRYVAPGIVDAHVHMMWSPGCMLRYPETRAENWATTCGSLLPHYRRSYLASGVTTIVDFAGPGFVHKAMRDLDASGAPGPRYLFLSPVLATAGGYGSQRPYADPAFRIVATEQDVDKAIADARAAGAIGVKVLLESGFIDFQKMPTHSVAILDRLDRVARQQKVPLFVHASSEADMARALAVHPQGLAHTLINRDKPLSDAFVRQLAASGTFQITTLQTSDSYLYAHEPARLDRDIMDVVPQAERDFARDRANADRAVRMLSGNPADPVAVKQTAEALSPSRLRATLAVSGQALRQLSAAHVPIVLGSDTPHHPFALYSFHGPSTLREMELLAEAGLTPMQVLTAATLAPARMLGLERRQGTVEKGKRADLVILDRNPATDVSAWLRPHWVVQAGRADTPAGWLSSN